MSSDHPHTSAQPSGPDPLDARFDASLRAAAQGATVPADPTAAQIQRWKHGEGRALAFRAPERRASSGGRRRGWFAGLSAAAAMVAMGSVAFFTLPFSRPVQASTILNSLRSANVSGVKITMTDLKPPGSTCNGELHIHFPEAFPVVRILDENAQDTLPEPSEIYMKVDVQMDDDGPIPGLHAQAEGALSDASSWFFAKSTEIPREHLKNVPPVAIMVSGFLKNGMLIDLGAGLPAKLDEHRDEHRRALEIHGNARGEMQARIRDRLAERAAKHHKDHDADEPAGAPDKDGVQVNGLEQFLPQIRALLSGSADATELESIRQLLQNEAAGAAVDPQGDGRYLLSVAMPEDAGKHALMRISYVQGSGVEWVDFTNLERLAGTLRIEFVNAPIDPAKLDKARLIEDGRTMLITPEMVQQWAPLLGFGAGLENGDAGDGAPAAFPFPLAPKPAPAKKPTGSEKTAPAKPAPANGPI